MDPFKYFGVIRMNKILTTLMLSSFLAACGSTQPEFTADKDVAFKADLTNHSMAYNIAMAAGAPDTLKDAEVPEEAYNEISGWSHSASFAAGLMANGLGSAFSFGLNSLMSNKANGFDDPLLIMWLEVDSLEHYGTDDFEKQVYVKARDIYRDKLLGDDEITRESGRQDKSGYAAFFKGPNCNAAIKTNPVEDKYESEQCLAIMSLEIVRPVAQGEWLPPMLDLDGEKDHVVVKFKYQSQMIHLAHDKFSNAVAFEPSQYTVNVKYNGDWIRTPVTNKFPFIRYQDSTYLFIKPKQ